MENTTNEKLVLRLRRGLRTSAVAMILCITGLINVITRSNIRTVDILPIFGCGIATGAFLVMLSIMYRVKKEQ